jgi:hypothetical protein
MLKFAKIMEKYEFFLFPTLHSLFSKTASISIYSAGLIQPLIQKIGLWLRMMLTVLNSICV